MKRFISLLLSLLILISISAVSASAGLVETRTYYYKDFSYYYHKNEKEIVISSYIGTASKVTIPSEINGCKVTALGDCDIEEGFVSGGFSKNKYIEEVKIPDTVEYVGQFCFNECYNLKKVKLGKNVKEIGIWAFLDCKSLKSINIPEAITDFDSQPFAGTNITKIRLTQNIKSADLLWLNLKAITVSKENKFFTAKDGVLYNKKKSSLVYYPNAKNKKTFKIPNKVQNIKKWAFDNTTKLKIVVLPKNLKLIESSAFCSTNISKIKFTGKKKVELQKYAFWECKKLKSVTVPKNVTKIGKQALGFYATDDEKNHIDIDHKIKNFTIKGKKNSAAHKYAKKYKFKFIAV